MLTCIPLYDQGIMSSIECSLDTGIIVLFVLVTFLVLVAVWKKILWK